MKILRAKSLGPLCLEDNDGDWWVCHEREVGKKSKKKTKYELAETVVELYDFFRNGSGNMVTYRHIKDSYGIMREVWNFKIAEQALAELEES